MAFSRLIWAGADYWRNNCYPSELGSIAADVSPGSAGTERVGKRELEKNQRERKQIRENVNERRNIRTWSEASKRRGGQRCLAEAPLDHSACQVVLPQLEVGCLCRVAEVNTHGNRH